MEEKNILKLDLIHSKIGYILACLSSYASLNLSKRILEINQNIDLVKKSFLENKNFIDIRNVISLREKLKELNVRLNDDADIEVPLDGHKIACLLFEVSVELKLLILDIDDSYEDIKEYLDLASKYLYNCARIVNIEILCY